MLTIRNVFYRTPKRCSLGICFIAVVDNKSHETGAVDCVSCLSFLSLYLTDLSGCGVSVQTLFIEGSVCYIL